jgi:hypothetical protein
MGAAIAAGCLLTLLGLTLAVLVDPAAMNMAVGCGILTATLGAMALWDELRP